MDSNIINAISEQLLLPEYDIDGVRINLSNPEVTDCNGLTVLEYANDDGELTFALEQTNNPQSYSKHVTVDGKKYHFNQLG